MTSPITSLPAITVGDIVTAIREEISFSSTAQVTDSQIIGYMNEAFQEMTKRNTTFSLVDTWEFMTTPGVDVYQFPQGNIVSIQNGTAIIDQQIIPMYNSRAQLGFYSAFQTRSNQIILTNLTGQTGPFTYKLGAPVARGYISLLGQWHSRSVISWLDSNYVTNNLVDNGDGNLYYLNPDTNTYEAYGTINYFTGEYNFSFPVPGYTNVYLNWDNSSWGKPVSGLFVDNTVVLRMVPNQPWRVMMQVEWMPALMTSVSDNFPLTQFAVWLKYEAAYLIASRNRDTMTCEFLNERRQSSWDNVLNMNYKNNNPTSKPRQFSQQGSDYASGQIINTLGWSASPVGSF